MDETKSGARFFLSKLGLKFLALLLGIMSWYLIQDAIRVESAQRKATLEARPHKATAAAVLHLERLPITALSRPGAWDWQIEPAVASVWLEGPAAELARLEKSSVRLFVDGTLITPAGECVMLPVKVHLPAEVRLKTESDPVLVRVAVRPALKGGP